MYKRQDNIKVAHSLIQSRRFTDHEHYYTSIFTIMATAQIINCLVCMEPVRPRQQGVQCDGCFRWSHRICNTGISQEVYRAAVRDGTDIEWRCILCEHPNAESTMEPMENVSLPDAESTRVEDTFQVEPDPSLPDAESTRVDDAFQVEPDPSLPDVESNRIENMSHAEPDPWLPNTEESSLHDPTPAEQSSSFVVTYEIVMQSSKRGRPKLIDNQGYCYSIQRQRGIVTDWQCSVRPKVNPCRATVRQRGDQFQCGNHVHNHQAQVGALMSAKITSHVKAKAVEDIFKPAPAIVDAIFSVIYE